MVFILLARSLGEVGWSDHEQTPILRFIFFLSAEGWVCCVS